MRFCLFISLIGVKHDRNDNQSERNTQTYCFFCQTQKNVLIVFHFLSCCFYAVGQLECYMLKTMCTRLAKSVNVILLGLVNVYKINKKLVFFFLNPCKFNECPIAHSDTGWKKIRCASFNDHIEHSNLVW